MDTNGRPKLWYDRGYLPHFDGGQVIQFLTFRLADSLPQNVIERYRLEFEQGSISDREYYRKIERYFDRGLGPRYLSDPRVADRLEETIRRFDGVKYKLFSWVIMPNHVHILLSPLVGVPLASIMHSIKSYTANSANRILGLSGKFWSAEYFDRYIRDAGHFERTFLYIERNPVKAGLVSSPKEWRYSSARYR